MGNWKEDFGHENGNYENICIDCGDPFIGHKRRQVCKSCAYDSVKADLQRHKDALGRVGEKVSEFEGHSFDCESNEVMDDLEAMFDSDGYIWPIEGKDDADTQR